MSAERNQQQQLVGRALDGEPAAVETLVDLLTPVIQARVARAVTRNAAFAGRGVRQEVEDLTQEVFVSLFAQKGKALRAWDPERGLSLLNFVGLLAQRQVASFSRSGRRSGWREETVEQQSIDQATLCKSPGPEQRASSRQYLAMLLDRLQQALSPKGLELFHRLMVQQEPVEQVCAETGMSSDAIYAWRSRLGRRVKQLAREMDDEVLGEPALASSDTAASGRKPRWREANR